MAVWGEKNVGRTMAIMEQFPTPEKSLPRCLSLVNGYLFLLVRNDDLGLLGIWPFDIDHPFRTKKKEKFPILSRTKSRWYWRPVEQVHDAVTSNGSDQEPKCHGEQKSE